MPLSVKVKIKAQGAKAEQLARSLSGGLADASVPRKGGSTNLRAGSMKYVALRGREQNLAGKKEFRSGRSARGR